MSKNVEFLLLYNYLLVSQASVINIENKLQTLQDLTMASFEQLTEALSKNTAATTELLDAVVANDARQEEIILELQAAIPKSEKYSEQFEELISLIADNTQKLNAAKEVQQQTDIVVTSPDVEEDTTSPDNPSTLDDVVIAESEAGAEGSVSIDTAPSPTEPANNVSLS